MGSEEERIRREKKGTGRWKERREVRRRWRGACKIGRGGSRRENYEGTAEGKGRNVEGGSEEKMRGKKRRRLVGKEENGRRGRERERRKGTEEN